MKISCLLFILLLSSGAINAQNRAYNKQNLYVGAGMGFDYGGLGAKLEFLPIKHLGIFGGVGYNLLSVGWNVGGSFKLLPDKKVTPTLSAFYGYNGALKTEIIGPGLHFVEDYTSQGITFGGGVDIKFGRRGHKLTTSLLIPIREKDFRDKYNEVKDSPYFDIERKLLPIGISVGFNFALQ